MVHASDVWLSHVLCDQPYPFPRDVGVSPATYRWRRKAHTRREYLDILSAHVDDKDLYVAIFSDWQLADRTYNKIFLDLDAKDGLDRAFRDLQTLTQHVLKRYGRPPRLYFTGGRGFHVYLDFTPTTLSQYGDVVRSYVYELEFRLRLTTPCRSVVGDRRRVARVPYSIHQTRHRFCISIDPFWSLQEVLWYSRNPKIMNVPVVPLPGLAEELKTLERRRERFSFENPSPLHDVDDYVHDLTIFLELAESGLDDCRHRLLHFAIVPRLVELGKSDEEILTYAYEFIHKSSPVGRKDWSHYERAVQQSITRTREGGWRPWGWPALITTFPELRLQLKKLEAKCRDRISR